MMIAAFVFFLLMLLLPVELFVGVESATGPVDHSVYVWQRYWNEPVQTAVRNAANEVSGFVILGGEISWDAGEMKFISADADYRLLAELQKPVGIALRIGPYPDKFTPGGKTVTHIADISRSLVDKAAASGLAISEFQLDFDCPESKLNSYRHLLKGLLSSIGDVPLTITALPSWLKHRSFTRLAKLTDGYVLQIHSLERPKSIDEPMVLCDPKASLKWVEKAGRIGVNFRVALPTYGYYVAFAVDGKFMGLVAEGQSRNWDSETLLVKVSSDPVEMAALVAAWTQQRPACMEGVIWYRLPVESDELNWTSVTLSTIIAGKIPVNLLRVEIDYPSKGLAEIMLVNDGHTDQRSDLPINVECPQKKIIACDGMRGYSIVNRTAAGFVLEHDSSKEFSTIRPGQRLKTGWIRLEHEMEIKAYVDQR